MDVVMDSLASTVSRLVPEKSVVLTVTSPSFFGGGNNAGFSRLMLKQPEERERSQQEIVNKLTSVLRQSTEAKFLVIQDPTISTGGRAGLPVQYVLQATSLEDVRATLPRFLAAASTNPTFTVVDANLKFTKPEVVVSIDRERARDLGVSVRDVAQVLQAGLSGQRFGYFMLDGKQYQIVGEVERNSRSTPDNLRSLGVHTASGAIVPLASLVTLQERSTPPALFRYDRNVAATISAGLVPGKTIADGIAAMDGIADTVLNDRFSTTLAGESRDFAESSSSLVWAFMLALILVYLVLAAQFESFVDPFTIMLTVPLALAGGVLALWVTGDTLNIFSEIGAVTLIGLITKNGILIVEFANQKREQGASLRDAAMMAAATRFRPILMTTLATILGALPIALSLGASSESRVGLGVVVVGGMAFSTVLSLFVIPSLYVVLGRFKKEHVERTS
jgi:multidrug efflux pump subunit AcrB